MDMALSQASPVMGKGCWKDPDAANPGGGKGCGPRGVGTQGLQLTENPDTPLPPFNVTTRDNVNRVAKFPGSCIFHWLGIIARFAYCADHSRSARRKGASTIPTTLPAEGLRHGQRLAAAAQDLTHAR